MALLQISEPGQSTAPHEHRLAVGIDLGTTHSLVASVRSGEAATLSDQHGDHLLPSVVQYISENEIRVGRDAKKAAALDPLNTIISVKRLMGRSRADIEAADIPIPYTFAEDDSNVPRIQTVAGKVSAVEVSAEILKQLRDRAEATLGGDLEGSVITVPAYFDDAQRQATKDAARLAGLKVLRLINEPTAAAVAYGLDKGADGTIVVYDLGGGTFDVSILRLNKGVFEVLATAGDSALGGDDFDLAIAQWIMEQASIGNHNDHFESRRLLDEACRAKEALSTETQVDIKITRRDGSQWQGTLTLDTMNELLKPLIRKTLSPCRRALRDAGIRVDEINEVVLVGGSTRVLQVRAQVAEFFKSEVLAEIDPDKVVAIGAAIQADVLVGNKPDDAMLLLDVIPLSLGIETMGGLAEKIIPRNTTIPVARAQDFTTYKDGQSAMSLHVVQGEREMVSDCRSLARFTLHGIPPMVAGAAHIRVTFQVDADGLLSVTAQEKTTGVQNGIEVKPSYGLSDTEIEQMLTDSISHATEDMLGRRLREQQVEADRVLEALHAALESDGDKYLSESERETISAAMKALQETKLGDDHLAIKSAIAAVEKACASYVERRMNSSIQNAMAGRKVNEFEE